MAQNRLVTIGPVTLSNTLTTNILNGNVTSLAGPVGITLPQPIIILRRIRITNRTGAAATFSLWLGATGANAAGTEFIGTGVSVAANGTFDWYGLAPLSNAQFIVGGSNTLNALTFQAEGEIGF